MFLVSSGYQGNLPAVRYLGIPVYRALKYSYLKEKINGHETLFLRALNMNFVSYRYLPSLPAQVPT